MADTNVQIRLQLDGSKAVMDGLKSIGDAAQSTNRMLTQLGGALAAAAGLGSLGQAAINTARLGGQLADLSARTGMSAQSLIVLRQAFKDAGIGADSVGKFVNLLQKNLYEAATNGGAAAEALDGMGLSAGKLIGLASEDQFQAVSAAISAIENPAQRTAAAMAIFGKSAGELLPLFSDGGAIDSATKSLGKMPDVLGRNVPILDSISDAIDRLPNKATQLFAGIADQVGPAIDSIINAFDKIDLTNFGQKIGAYINVGVEMFKQGRFSDFLSLSIGAAFEIGIKKGKEWLDWLFSTPTANAIGNFTVTFMAEMAKAFISMGVFFRSIWHGLMIYAGSSFAEMLRSVLNFFLKDFQDKINILLTLWKSAFPNLGKVISGPVKIPLMGPMSKDFDTSMAEGMKVAEAEATTLKIAIDKTVDAYRKLFDIRNKNAKSPDTTLGAFAELSQMVQKQLLLRELVNLEEELNKIENEDITKNIQVDVMNMKLELVKLELFYSSELSRINERRGSVEANWLMTNTAKYQEKKKLLEDELQLLLDQEIELQNLLKVASSEEAPGIQKRLQSVQTQQGGVENQMMGMGPSPTSFSEQFSSTLVELQNQFGSWAQQTAKTFADVFNSAISSISNGITGLIMGTMTWAQALAQIGNTILTTVVQSIVQMGVRWVLTQVMMATVGRSLQAAMLASMIPVALAQSAILATPATLATIASFGGAAAQAPAAIGAAQGIVLAQSLAAFREGGYTGSGNPDEVAGIVHRGEYVVPAEAVAMVGLDSLEAMFSGVPTSGATVVSAPMSAPAPIVMNMGVFDDPRRLTDWARSNDGRTVLVDILRQHAHEFRA